MKSAWLSRPAPRGASACTLLVFPHSGGGPAAFHTWSHAAPAEIEIATVHLPGRERRWREPPLRRVDAIVGELRRELRDVLDGPCAFLGHSFGALVAYELALQLERESARAPRHLFAAACRAPHALEPGEPIHALPDDAFVAAVSAYGGLPEEIARDRSLLELFLPALRADFEAFESYERARPDALGCAITALGAGDDPAVPSDALGLWRAATRAGLRVELFDGGHFFVHEARERILALVERTLLEGPALARPVPESARRV